MAAVPVRGRVRVAARGWAVGLVATALLVPLAPAQAVAVPPAVAPAPVVEAAAVSEQPLAMPAPPQASEAFTAQPSGGGVEPAAVDPLPEMLKPGQVRFTPFSRSEGNADGTVTAQVFNAPAFTRDASGMWRATRDELRETGDAQRPLAAPGAFRPMSFGSDPRSLVRLDLPRGPVTISSAQLGRATPAKKGRSAHYRGVATDTDLEFEVSPAGLRQSLVLHSDKAPRTVKFHISDPAGQLGTATRTATGGYRFSGDVGDGISVVLDPAVAFEQPQGQDLPVLEPGSASMSVVKSGDGFDVVKTVSESWLAGKSYPIVLDPSLRFDAGNVTVTDCWLRGGANADTRWCFNSLVAGNVSGDPSRTVLGFGFTNSIPLGSRVDGASLNMYQTGNTFGGQQTITVSRQALTGPSFTNDATWNTYDGVKAWTSAGSVAGGGPVSGNDLAAFANFVTTSSTAGYRTVTDSRLTDQVQRWVHDAQQNNGFHLRTLESTSNGYVKWGSSKQTRDTWPYLTVDYTPPTAPTLTPYLATDRGCGTALPAAAPIVAGSVVNVCVKVKNTNAYGGPVRARVSGALPAGLNRLRLRTSDGFEDQQLAVNGKYCPDGFDEDYRCSARDNQVFASVRLALNAEYALGYTAQVVGDDLGCRPLTQNSTGWAFDEGTGPTSSASLTLRGCEGGLGVESWWSFDSRKAGPHADLGVNVGNGNLVVQAVDGTAVQGHGQLALFLRRTYNSRDTATLALPGTLGAGWTLATGDAGDLAGAGVTPAGLYVPTLADAKAALTSPLSVVLVDRDGTKHRFTRRGEGLDVAALLPAPKSALDALRGALVPRELVAPDGFNTTLCVDTSYDAPAGVHLSLWRYLAVSGTSCGTGSATDFTVVGYATVRPDRLRSEFDLLGRLRNLTDATGNQLSYTYTPSGVRGAGALAKIAEKGPAGTAEEGREYRSLRFEYPSGSTDTVVRDSAGRTIVYSFTGGDPTAVARTSPTPADAVPTATTVRLATVTTYRGEPAGGAVLARERYAYWGHSSSNGLSCPSAPSPQPTGTLCAASDPRGSSDSTSAPVTVSYDSSDPSTTRVASHTDRRGTLTRIAYGSGLTSVDRNPSGDRGYPTAGLTGDGTPDVVRRTLYSSIDSIGRVGRVDRGRPGSTPEQITASSTTTFAWDSAAASCRLPAGVDNNLCSRTEGTSGGSASPYTTDLLYGQEGQLLRETRYAGAGRTRPLSTTHSWRSQYLTRAGDSALCRDYLAPGSGSSQLSTDPACSASPAADTLFALTDRTSTLSPRGNGGADEAGVREGTSVEQYRTRLLVDNNLSKATHRPAVATAFGNTGTSCGEAASPASNTGLRCAEIHPVRAGSEARTSYGVNSRGQRTSRITPLALTRAGSTATAAAYRYGYYDPTSTDLSGTASAAGWLKTVTDPNGKFVAFGYDAAGNTARTFDRNATSGPADTFNPATAAGFSEVLHGPDGYASPWRYPLRHTTVEGRRTEVTVDANGNSTAITDPRRNTTSQTFNGDDQLTSSLQPEQAAQNKPSRIDYDRYGNVVRTVNPNGHVTATSYTTSEQAQVTAGIRGTAPTTSTGGDSTDCYDTNLAATDLPGGLPAGLPTNSLACASVTSYDDGRQPTGTRDAHRATTRTYRDAAGRVIDTVVPRSSTLFRHTVAVYDHDGQALRVCRPRSYGLTDSAPREASSCTATQVHATHALYNPAGLLVSELRYRDSTTLALRTSHSYDTDGNQVSSTDPNGNAASSPYATTHAFDLLNRRTSTTTPRSATGGPGGGPKTVTTGFDYDPVGNPVLTRWPDGQREANAYDRDHRRTDTVTGYTGPTGTLSELRDGARAALSSPDGGSNTHTRLVYDANSNIIVRYGPRAFLQAGAPDERFAQRLSYDRNNRPTAAAVGRYDTADSTLADASGQPSPQQREQCPTGRPGWPSTVGVCTTTLSYDPAGNRTRLTLPTSNGTDRRYLDYRYSHDNLLTAVLSPDPTDGATGQVTSSTGYDGVGRPVLTITPPTASSPGGRRSTSSYNADGTLARTEQPGPTPDQPRRTSFGYDADNNNIDLTDPKGQISRTSYASDGVVTRRVDTGGNTTSYSYDRNGNTDTVSSPSANAGDATNPHRTPTRYTYTRDNLLNTVTKPADNDGSSYLHAYSYDDSGRKTSFRSVRRDSTGAVVDNPGAQSFSYYPNNRTRSEVGRRPDGQAGQTITRCYTADGQQSVITDLPADSTGTDLCASGPVATSTDSILTRGYYLDGLLRQARDGLQTLTYGYDGLGSLTARTETVEGSGKATRYGYNDAELLTSQTADTVTGLSNPGWTTSYDRNGRPSSQTQPNGQSLTWAHGDDDTLTRQQLTMRNGDQLTHAYGYDTLTRQTSQTLTRQPSGGTAASSTDTFAYDPAGRLASFTDGDTGSTVHGRWDADGNRTCWGTSCNGTPAAGDRASYNPDDSLRTDRGSSFINRYDGAGRRTADSTSCYRYDGFDRLTAAGASLTTLCAPPSPSTESASYGYDGLDRQRQRTISGASDLTSGLPNPARISYDADSTRPLAQMPADSTTNNVLRTVLSADGTAVATIPSAGSPHLLTHDGHGNTATDTDTSASLTNPSGLACFTRYTPFGEARGTLGGTQGNPCTVGQGSGSTSNDLLFANERRDPATTNYQLGARTYQPGQGTFLQSDSDRSTAPAAQPGIGFDPLTANTYTYVNGDPVNYTDPTGHEPRVGRNGRVYGCASAACDAVRLTPKQAYDHRRKEFGAQLAARNRMRHQQIKDQVVRDRRVQRAQQDDIRNTRRLIGGDPSSSSGLSLQGLADAAFLEDLDSCQRTIEDKPTLGGGLSCIAILPWGKPAKGLKALDEAAMSVDELAEIGFRSDTSHIFRNATGHLTHDTAENRALIKSALDPANLRDTITLKDGATLQKYFRELPDGTQAWAEVRNGVITNGGLNVIPR